MPYHTTLEQITHSVYCDTIRKPVLTIGTPQCTKTEHLPVDKNKFLCEFRQGVVTSPTTSTIKFSMSNPISAHNDSALSANVTIERC